MEQELDMAIATDNQTAIAADENTSQEPQNTQKFELIAKTFMGLEPILAQELREMGAEQVQEGRRVVTFWGDKEMMYRANFQLHTAIRILKPIRHFKAASADDVYNEVMKVDWEQYLSLKTTFAVDSVVFSEEFTHSKFVAYKVKDAIADQFRERTGQRPNVSVANPNIRLHIHIADKDATLCLDSSGTSLHQRGYRQESVAAPLNEVLAAGMILMSGWKGDTDFIDPMCGSGTLLIEAALIARNMAPGIFRKEYAFEKWPDFDQDLFDEIYNDDSKEREFNHHIYGYDIDMKAVNTARMNVRAAGLTQDISIEQQDFKDFKKPEEPAIIISNPPYGERISTPNLLGTYKMIGEVLKHQFSGNEAWILSYREDCFEQIGLKPSIKIPLFNGSLECEFRKYQLFDGKLKVFREEGNILKTEEEKKAMAEKHRFKKNREFKKRMDEDLQNEDADIRSFTFHKHHPGFNESLFKPKREDRGEREFRCDDRRDNRRRNFEDRDDRKGGWKRDFKGKGGAFKGKGGDFKGKGGGFKGGKSFNRRNGASMILLLMMMLFNLNTSTNMMAQRQFTLEDLNFGGKNYHNMVPKNQYYTWWGDQLVRLDVEQCYLVDKTKGTENVLMSVEELNEWAGTADSLKVRHFYRAEFPYPDQPLILIQNQNERILVDFQQKRAVWRQSCKDIEEVDEGWCAKSRALAFRKGDNLYVSDAEGNTHQLSTDGSREIVYGKSVHRDEFGIYKGTFWSPDGQHLAFYRMDQTMVKDYPQVDIFQREATYEPDKYPMAGETSHKVTVGVYDLQTGKAVYLNAGDPTDRYFTNLAWSPDSKTVYMFELNRDQNDCRLVSYDAATGNRIAELYRETSEKYVEPQHPIVFLPWDSSKFIMQSQKDGFNHLYLFEERGARSGERCVEVRQLTKGNFVAIDMLGFDKKNKSVVVATNEKSAIQQNLFAVNVGNGKRTLLDNGRGYHGATLNPSGLWLLDKYQEPDVPRNIDVVNTKTGKSTRLLTAEDPWQGFDVPEYSCGTVKAADGVTDLYYRMVKPVGFDPQKKYPTVVYVYGGPHAHNVDARWHYCSRSWETYMAQKGYLLFIIDNRGSENRGRDFEQATFRQLGQVEMQDQMKGVEFLKSLPYVDQDRMGVHGWSFGGFMTISLLTNYPETFKVGVAGGPVIDWKWYEVMYGERYMDTPQTNPEGYEKTSLINKAKDLKGRLLIINGYNDPTVVPQHCLSFLAECIKEGTQPDFFVYPGEGHNMMGHSSVHLHEKITQYFEDFLK